MIDTSCTCLHICNSTLHLELWQKGTMLKKSLNRTTFNETVPKGHFIFRWEKVLAMRIIANKFIYHDEG